jgi:serine/threonine protein kinase
VTVQSIRTIKIFYCYAQEDDALREELARHLSPFRRLRYITGWYNRDIRAGTDWEQDSRTHLEAAHIILLLLSAHFFASDYHYAVEMEQAIRKHNAGLARVIPILLRPVAWKETPIGELSALPANEKPITKWANRDEAWLQVVEGIREVIRDLLQKQPLSSEENNVLYPERGPLSGQIIGNKYLLGELLGEGAFSQVYRAQHIEVQRQQAVKVLHEHYFRKKEFQHRFFREAQAMASLEHSHIVHLDDFGTEASRAYLVMPFISGGTLQGVLDKQQGFLEQHQIVFYLECICDALDYAHRKGIVHLDLKPLNLLMHEDGRLLLSDFGLAHLMKRGVMEGGSSLRAGTPHYMAPEHINGSPEKRSDLFSLGVILYQMLVGRLPFDGSFQETVLVKNITEWPTAPRLLRPELPPAVDEVVGKALAKQPASRYQTADEFFVAFKKAISTPTQLSFSGPSCNAVMTVRRNPHSIESLITSLTTNENRRVRQEAAEALGKLGNPQAIEPLIAALKDEHEWVRHLAAEALGKLGDLRAVEPLIAVLEDKYERVQEAASSALDKLGGPRVVEPLIATLTNEEAKTNRETKIWIARKLRKMGDSQAVEPLIAAFTDADHLEKGYIAEVLGELGDQRAVEPLIAILAHGSGHWVQMLVIEALGKLGDQRAVEPLIIGLTEDWFYGYNDDNRGEAIEALGKLGDQRAVEPLIIRLIEGWPFGYSDHHREKAIEALGKLGDSRAVEPLIAVLTGKVRATEDAHWSGKKKRMLSLAATALGKLRDPRAVEPLMTLLQDEDGDVRKQAAWALGEMS